MQFLAGILISVANRIFILFGEFSRSVIVSNFHLITPICVTTTFQKLLIPQSRTRTVAPPLTPPKRRGAADPFETFFLARAVFGWRGRKKSLFLPPTHFQKTQQFTATTKNYGWNLFFGPRCAVLTKFHFHVHRKGLFLGCFQKSDTSLECSFYVLFNGQILNI